MTFDSFFCFFLKNATVMIEKQLAALASRYRHNPPLGLFHCSFFHPRAKTLSKHLTLLGLKARPIYSLRQALLPALPYEHGRGEGPGIWKITWCPLLGVRSGAASLSCCHADKRLEYTLIIFFQKHGSVTLAYFGRLCDQFPTRHTDRTPKRGHHVIFLIPGPSPLPCSYGRAGRRAWRTRGYSASSAEPEILLTCAMDVFVS